MPKDHISGAEDRNSEDGTGKKGKGSSSRRKSESARSVSSDSANKNADRGSDFSEQHADKGAGDTFASLLHVIIILRKFSALVIRFFPKLFSTLSLKVSSDGYKMIFAFLLVTLATSFIGGFLFFLSLVFSAWCIYFFRDPERHAPDLKGAVLSPADGVVSDISAVQPPMETGVVDEMRRVSIFLSVFNVHVNRFPLDGVVKKIVYHAGSFLNASLNKASEENERNTIVMELKDGQCVVLCQIAGLIARRIVCRATKDQEVGAGDRFGIIKFGSRVDLYLPLHVKVCAKVGQVMVGGESVIGFIDGPETKSISGS